MARGKRRSSSTADDLWQLSLPGTVDLCADTERRIAELEELRRRTDDELERLLSLREELRGGGTTSKREKRPHPDDDASPLRMPRFSKILTEVATDLIQRRGPRPIAEIYFALPADLRARIEAHDTREIPLTRLQRAFRRNPAFIVDRSGAVSLAEGDAELDEVDAPQIERVVRRASDGAVVGFDVVERLGRKPTFVSSSEMKRRLLDDEVIMLPPVKHRHSRLILFDTGYRGSAHGRLNKDILIVPKRIVEES